MSSVTIDGIVHAIRDQRLLRPAQLEELSTKLCSAFPDPRNLARELIRRSWITPYQANLLLQGRFSELAIGSYVVLQRLGEGGHGLVFKAKHRGLGRVSAVKLIPPDRLAGEDAVGRFFQSVRAVSMLDHPNLVLAQDADEADGTYLLMMEYIEGGVDLGRLVAQRGAFPITSACACIRQAALGLQHGVERGLIHGGLKPSKLLLTRDRTTIKVLDVGLARVGPRGESEANEKGPSDLDFLSPEQAGPPYTADARSDVYALGCTFYFLLTSRVPFPGGTPAQKRQMHLSREPEPIERLRPEVNTDIAAILKRMMAKQPEARYSSLGEVAQALTAVVNTSIGAELLPKDWEADVSVWEELDFSADGSGAGIQPAASEPGVSRRGLLWLAAGAVGVFIAAAVAIGLIFRMSGSRSETPEAVVTGTPAAKLASLLEFDGKDDFITLPDNLIRASGTLTFEAWVRTERKGGVILGYENEPYPEGATERVPAVYIGDDGKVYACFWEGDSKPIASPDAIADGRWHHLAFVANDKAQTLFIDGKQAATRPGKGLNHLSMSHNQLGGGHVADWIAAGADAFRGSLRDVRVWYVVRNADEIKKDMNRRLTGNEKGLAAYYPLDEATGDRVQDLSPQHRHGKLGNGHRRFMPRNIRESADSTPPEGPKP
jgi:serine/threonine-protein kinase